MDVAVSFELFHIYLVIKVGGGNKNLLPVSLLAPQ